MALDYSERRQVSRNRPKKRPARAFLVLIGGCLAVMYGLGVATGWLIFRPMKQNSPIPPPPSVASKGNQKTADQAAGKAVPPPVAPQGGGNEIPLTFYHTLPKGDKGVLGSGLNPPHGEGKSVPKNVLNTTPVPLKDKASVHVKVPDQKSAKTAQEGKVMSAGENMPEAKSPQTSENRKQKSGNGGYSVQIASYHVRKEAEDVKANLEKNGFAARIVESTQPGKGVLYRVRVGAGLDQEAATQLSGKVGHGAIVVPE